MLGVDDIGEGDEAEAAWVEGVDGAVVGVGCRVVRHVVLLRHAGAELAAERCEAR